MKVIATQKINSHHYAWVQENGVALYNGVRLIFMLLLLSYQSIFVIAHFIVITLYIKIYLKETLCVCPLVQLTQHTSSLSGFCEQGNDVSGSITGNFISRSTTISLSRRTAPWRLLSGNNIPSCDKHAFDTVSEEKNRI
jgi:hypothetical protein